MSWAAAIEAALVEFQELAEEIASGSAEENQFAGDAPETDDPFGFADDPAYAPVEEAAGDESFFERWKNRGLISAVGGALFGIGNSKSKPLTQAQKDRLKAIADEVIANLDPPPKPDKFGQLRPDKFNKPKGIKLLPEPNISEPMNAPGRFRIPPPEESRPQSQAPPQQDQPQMGGDNGDGDVLVTPPAEGGGQQEGGADTTGTGTQPTAPTEPGEPAPPTEAPLDQPHITPVVSGQTGGMPTGGAPSVGTQTPETTGTQTEPFNPSNKSQGSSNSGLPTDLQKRLRQNANLIASILKSSNAGAAYENSREALMERERSKFMNYNPMGHITQVPNAKEQIDAAMIMREFYPELYRQTMTRNSAIYNGKKSQGGSYNSKSSLEADD